MVFVEGRGYQLGGEIVHVGDVIEVYTNDANGWLRGRFEWNGGADDGPRIAVNLWDPYGAPDEDGLPPWVGEIDIALPARAICRR